MKLRTLTRSIRKWKPRADRDKEFYKRFCNTLDAQIDDLVYQLYDITPEERRIIEA